MDKLKRMDRIIEVVVSLREWCDKGMIDKGEYRRLLKWELDKINFEYEKGIRNN